MNDREGCTAEYQLRHSHGTIVCERTRWHVGPHVAGELVWHRPSDVNPAYKEGWNDKVLGTVFKVFRSAGGDLLHNWPDPLEEAQNPKWAGTAREEYVRGWEEATAAILALELQ